MDAWLPAFFKIDDFVLNRKKKLLQIWNYLAQFINKIRTFLLFLI